MTKDEIIAEQASYIRWLQERVAVLQDALLLSANQGPLTQAERSQRWRNARATETQRDSNEIATDSVAAPPTTPVTSLSTSPKERNLKVPKEKGDDGFDQFHDAYPKSGRTSWLQARRTWGTMSSQQRQQAVIGAKHYATSRDVTEGYEKGAQAWLRARLWESWQQPDDRLSVATGEERDENGLTAQDHEDNRRRRAQWEAAQAAKGAAA